MIFHGMRSSAPVFERRGDRCFVQKREVNSETSVYSHLSKTIKRYRRMMINSHNDRFNFSMTWLDQVTQVTPAHYEESINLAQRIHKAKVIHGDLKNVHVRKDQRGHIVFIDFGESLFADKIEGAISMSLGFASLERLLCLPLNALDDLESLVLVALHSNGWGPVITSGQRTQATTQLRFLAHAFATHSTEENPFRRRLLKCLVYLSQVPRNSENPFDVEDEVYDNLQQKDFDFKNEESDQKIRTHYENIRDNYFATVSDREVREADVNELHLKKMFPFSERVCGTKIAQCVLTETGLKVAKLDDKGQRSITSEEAKYGGSRAELDSVHEVGLDAGQWYANNPTLDVGQLQQPYEEIIECPGFIFVREISNTSKTWDDLNKKLVALLPKRYRPHHVMRMFVGLDIICNGLP